MVQKSYRPKKRPNKQGQADDQRGMYSSFQSPDNSLQVSKDAEDTVSDIDRVLAENAALPKTAPLDPEAIKSAEENAEGGSTTSQSQESELDQLGRGYSEEKEKRGIRSNRLTQRLALNRRNKLLAGGTLGGLVGALIISAIFTLPLKVQHIAENLQNEFFASAEEATEKMTDQLLRSYVVKYLAPGMVQNNCTSSRVNKNCVNTSNSSNIVGVLYNGWRDGRLEQRLADKGIEIQREGNRFFLQTPSTRADLGTYDPLNPGAFEDSAFKEMSRNEIRKEVRKSFADETKWKRIWYRFKVGGLLERKYGVKRCIVGCVARDKLSDNIEAKKGAFKAWFVQRVIGPQNEFMSLAVECAFGGFKCTENQDSNERGERLSQIEIDFQVRLQEFRQNYPNQSLDDLHKESETIRNTGFVEYMLKKVVGDATARLAAKTIPIIGWIDTGAQLFSAAQNAGPAITKLAYLAATGTGVRSYMMIRTAADEMRTGDTDSAALGSITQAFSTTDGVDRKDQNGVGAEGSPLWGEVMGSGTKTAAFNPLSTQKAYAANSYGCEDNGNKPPPAGQPVCDVERVDNKTSFGSALDKLSDLTNSPMLIGGSLSAQFWNGTIGKLLRAAESVAGPLITAAINLIVPGDLAEKLAALAVPIMQTFMDYVFRPIITASMSGARFFNIVAMGAANLGNDYAHYGIGGAQLTAAEASAIRTEREQERQAEFNSRSAFARIFSTDTKYSLVSKIAIASPGQNQLSFLQSSLGTITNPFSAAGSSLASTVFSKKVDAQSDINTETTWGIKEYGYSRNDPAFSIKDPEKFWDENDCDNPDKIKEWGNRSKDSPTTAMPDHDYGDTYPCLLIKSAAGGAGAKYTDAVLDPDELGEETAPLPTGSGGQFRLASFNICYGIAAGGSGYADCARGVDYKTRLAKTVNYIKSNSFDVVGLQEVRGPSTPNGDQYTDIQAALPDYGIYPKQYNVGYGAQNPIMWNSTKFALVEQGSKMIAGYTVTGGPNPSANTQVRLRYNETGQEFYLINQHEPVGNTVQDQTWRRDSANARAAYVNDLAKDGIPIFISGDMNSWYSATAGGQDALGGSRDNLPYCILTDGTGLWDALDANSNTTGKCPRDSGGGVDHIFMSTSVAGANYSYGGAGVANNGSDHNTLFIDVTFPSGDAENPTSPGGFIWPIKKVDHRGITVCWNENATGGYHAGIDIDVDNANPPPVYAAKNGTVSLTGSGGAAGNYVVIDHGGGIWTAYEHLTSFNVNNGQQVTAGYNIGQSGTTGNSSGAHLHFGVVDHNGLGSYSSSPQTDTKNPLDFLPKDGRDLGGCG